MRRGLTLIELIFTMVIVAITFMVIPKLIQAFSRIGSTVIKEDAMYNTITMMNLITRLPWDKNSIESDSILKTNNINACDPTTGYRVGGFPGGRSCIDKTFNASPIAHNHAALDSIGEYNGESLDTITPCNGQLYDLGVSVNYSVAGTRTDIKHIAITTGYDTALAAHGNFCVILDYNSYNLGRVPIKRRRWQ